MDGRGREEINEEIYSPNPHYFRVMVVILIIKIN